LLRVGMVVLRSMSLVKMPPLVSTPRDSGVTSSSRMSLTSPFSTPAWMAAPTATTSSGLTPLWGSWPPVSFRTRSWIMGIRVAPVRVLELPGQPVDDPLVPVVPTELRVSRGRLDLEHALADLQQRDVERPASQVEHQDGLVVLLVQPVGQRRGGGLVDDPQD